MKSFHTFNHPFSCLRKLKQQPAWVILLVFGLIQLIGITDPPLEMAHSWRQSFTAMITRNYAEMGMDWLHPRIDMAGEKPGIVGSEFPLFNFLSLIFCKLFGYQHWYGRAVNVAFVIWGAQSYYLIVKNRFSGQTALYAMVVLLCSSWFTFSRKIMPDTFSVSLVLIGIRYAFDYYQSGSLRYYFLSIMLVAFGVLSKIPAMSLLAMVGVLPFMTSVDPRKKRFILLGVLLGVAPGLWWYFFWVPHLNTTYGYHLYFPKGLLEGLMEILPLWRLLLEKFYFTSYYSFLALLLAFVGLISLKSKSLRTESWALTLITLVFCVFVLKTGAVFPQHTYYSIPFIPVMALLSGLGLDFLSERFKTVNQPNGIKSFLGYGLLFLLVVEALSNQIHDHFIKPSEKYKLSLETEIAAVIPMEARVVMVSSASPQELYLLHRKGWTIFPEQLLPANTIEKYGKLGADYLVINKPIFSAFPEKSILLHALDETKLFYVSNHYAVYRITH